MESLDGLQREDVDVQTRSILSGLLHLEKILSDTAATKIFDLADDANSARKYNMLKRLRRSLKQYVDREGHIFYVGFVGHFSSGKSSTINSILSLTDKQNARRTDLHPTDTDVTLITRGTVYCHKGPRKQLLHWASQGSLTI